MFLLKRPLFVLVLLLAAAGGVRPSQALETTARAAILMDAESGAVLFAKNPDERIPPASMSKMMTAYLIFERLNSGRLSMDDMISVSEKAWRMEGSKMWIEVGEQVRVEDLLQGLIVQSGNDAAVAFAEALAGSEDAFADEMNKKAADLGLTGSHFANSTGWPDPNHYMTVRDLGVMARRLILDFPEYYHFYSQTEFTWAGIKQPNRNPLLYRGIGADGVKTGHTKEAGYCLTASAVQNGRRLILVVTGLGSEKERAEESERLLAWGFREFATYQLFAAGEQVDTAPVFMGETDSVPLVLPQGVELNMLRSARDGMTVTLTYDAPLTAPVAQGQVVGAITVSAPGITPVQFPVVAGHAVGEMGIIGRMVEGVKQFIGG